MSAHAQLGSLEGGAMKAVSLAFLTLLLLAHCTGDPGKLVDLPLSLFRDGPLWAFGYALFALLLVAGGLMVATLLRAGLHGHTFLFSLTAVLLLLVAVSPSYNALHLFLAFVLLAVFYGYYAAVLHSAASPWLWAHLASPLLVLSATQFHSYGLWQKSFIVYFLLVVNVHHHLVTRGGAGVRKPQQGTWGSRRRVVYVVDAGKNWSRQKSSRERFC
jgi:hypothetical protein